MNHIFLHGQNSIAHRNEMSLLTLLQSNKPMSPAEAQAMRERIAGTQFVSQYAMQLALTLLRNRIVNPV